MGISDNPHTITTLDVGNNKSANELPNWKVKHTISLETPICTIYSSIISHAIILQF